MQLNADSTRHEGQKPNLKMNKMKENLLSVAPDFKLYKNRTVYIGTLLGGTLVAGYMAAENFKQLGQPEYTKRSWKIAIFTTILVLQ